MTGKSSQRKGAHAERELAQVLTATLGSEVHKGSSPYLPGLIAPDVLGVDGHTNATGHQQRTRQAVQADKRRSFPYQKQKQKQKKKQG